MEVTSMFCLYNKDKNKAYHFGDMARIHLKDGRVFNSCLIHGMDRTCIETSEGTFAICDITCVKDPL